MTAQDDFVKDQLDILQQMQIDGMDYEDYVRWKSKVNDVKKGYDEARAVERDEERTYSLSLTVFKLDRRILSLRGYYPLGR